METRKILFHATRLPFSNHVCLSIAERNTETGEIAMAQPLVFDPHDKGTVAPEAIALSQLDAQSLMDELFAAGIRPSEGSGSVGQLSAVQRHLEDMRTLVFKGEDDNGS